MQRTTTINYKKGSFMKRLLTLAFSAVTAFSLMGNTHEEIITHNLELLTINPNNVSAHFELGNIYFSQKKMPLAIKHFAYVAHLQPSPSTWYNLALCLRNYGQWKKARDAYQTTIQLSPRSEKSYQGIGYCHLALGNLAEGWKAFDDAATCNNPDAQPVAGTYLAKNLNDKHIIITDHGGYGDTIHWMRYAQLLKLSGAYVTAQVRPQFISIIKSCPFIDQVISNTDPLPAHDERIPMYHLKHTFNTILETIPAPIPYLHADSALVEKWHKYMPNNNKLQIGIFWEAQSYIDAHTKKPIINARSIPLAEFYPLAENDKIELYSLQKHVGLEQLKTVPNHLTIRTFPNDFDTQSGAFMDSAAIIKNLDLVITVDTSIAHLAGALGKQVWVLLPQVADWRWFLDRTDSPWYPSMKLFRNTENNWTSVIEKVCNELANITEK